MMLSIGLLLIAILGLSCLSTSIFKQQNLVMAQQYVQTIKSRNLVINLGNEVKTNATLTYPAVGKGPFPGVLLIQGAGVGRLSPEVAPYLSERGFAVLQYDKRGTNGLNHTIIDTNVWGNATVNDLIHDAEKALNVLIQQPEVDPKRISIIGHSDGTVITPRVAIDNSTQVKNIVMMGIVAQKFRDIVYYQHVNLPLAYATQVLDKNHTGFIPLQQIAKAPVLIRDILPPAISQSNNTKAITNTLAKELGTNGYVSIDRQLRPSLIKALENDTSLKWLDSKCNNLGGCSKWAISEFNIEPDLSIIGNVSKSTGILLLNGENDSQTPVQQAFLLQQRLTDVNHPDHALITYSNLGHVFYPSSQWSTSFGPFEPYVLADIYTWLASHSGLSHYITTPTSTGANRSTGGIFPIFTHNTNKTSSNETQVLQSTTNIVKLLADMVQNRLHDATNLLELTSTDPEVKNTSLVGDISKAYMGLPGNMDIQGRKTAKDILNRDEDFGSVYFTTSKGDVYFGEPYADQKQLPKLNYADRDWYKGVTSTNHTYISSIFTSASIHEPATAIAVPVYNKAIGIDNTTKSHLSGYWVGVLDLRSISESIKKLDLNQNDRILIVDHTGTIINSHSGLQNTTSTIPMPTESIKSVLAGDAGSKIEIINGIHILTNFQPFNVGTHIWGIVLVHPYH
jgi:uncharacterized protein